ncbi:MAG: FAD:protein FMN transferase [Halieaceae bacterium]|nr:FAD:protein FMN transferase [Halieaceae bacterium]
MGTSWSLTYLPPTADHNSSMLGAALEAELLDINQSMSTYVADSEINRVSSAAAEVPIKVSTGFAYVLDHALTLSRLTAGAYDVTVEPLVLLWGFGPEFKKDDLPSEAEVAAVQAQVGYQALELDLATRTLVKTSPRSLDFSSIAKGYGVDRLANLLRVRGIDNFMVEIGGELKVQGLNPEGQPWRIAVRSPRTDAVDVATTIILEDMGVATSGDYFNFFRAGGQNYSHVIDPTTGWPIQHEVVSVTVVEQSVTRADGLATGLLVLGKDKALALAEENQWAVLILARTEEGIESFPSSEFARLYQ